MWKVWQFTKREQSCSQRRLPKIFHPNQHRELDCQQFARKQYAVAVVEAVDPIVLASAWKTTVMFRARLQTGCTALLMESFSGDVAFQCGRQEGICNPRSVQRHKLKEKPAANTVLNYCLPKNSAITPAATHHPAISLIELFSRI
jgi:hypothetical protein